MHVPVTGNKLHSDNIRRESSGTVTEYLQCARHYPKHFSWINLCKPHNNTMTWLPLQCSFYWWHNWCLQSCCSERAESGLQPRQPGSGTRPCHHTHTKRVCHTLLVMSFIILVCVDAVFFCTVKLWSIINIGNIVSIWSILNNPEYVFSL